MRGGVVRYTLTLEAPQLDNGMLKIVCERPAMTFDGPSWSRMPSPLTRTFDDLKMVVKVRRFDQAEIDEVCNQFRAVLRDALLDVSDGKPTRNYPPFQIET